MRSLFSLRHFFPICILAASFVPITTAARSEEPAKRRMFSPGYSFAQTSGEELFASVCQGCHMHDGMGAAGAGSYPSLSGNANLATIGYSVRIVIHGQRAMPPFGDMMNDDQIAAVINYVRSHFGNNYTDAVRARDVKEERQ